MLLVAASACFPGVCPFFLAEKKYLEATKDCMQGSSRQTSLSLASLLQESTEKITWAIAHEGGCARCSLPVLPDDRPDSVGLP